MKLNILFLLMLMLSSATVFSQNDPRSREKIKAAHAAYVTQRLELTTEEAERFWPVYREYSEKRREVRLEMRMSRKSEASDEAILKHDLELKQQELDLEKEYTKKLAKIISAEKLVKLREAEADFRKLLLKQVQERRRLRR